MKDKIKQFIKKLAVLFDPEVISAFSGYLLILGVGIFLLITMQNALIGVYKLLVIFTPPTDWEDWVVINLVALCFFGNLGLRHYKSYFSIYKRVVVLVATILGSYLFATGIYVLVNLVVRALLEALKESTIYSINVVGPSAYITISCINFILAVILLLYWVNSRIKQSID